MRLSFHLFWDSGWLDMIDIDDFVSVTLGKTDSRVLWYVFPRRMSLVEQMAG